MIQYISGPSMATAAKWAIDGCFYWLYVADHKKHGKNYSLHCNDVIMSATASQFTSLAIVYSTVYSGADRRKHQSSASLAFVRGIKRWPVNSPHKRPVTRKLLPFDDDIMTWLIVSENTHGHEWSDLAMIFFDGGIIVIMIGECFTRNHLMTSSNGDIFHVTASLCG